MAHELTTAFAQAGRPLHGELAEMLDEHYTHRTERRGCGYAQATRWLAARVNARVAGEPADASLFDDRHAVEDGTDGWHAGAVDYAVGRASGAARALAPAPRRVPLASLLARIDASLACPESRLLLQLIAGLLDPDADSGAVPAMRSKPAVGSCPQAEEFFLEIAHGRVRRGGAVNVIVDALHRPVLLEKLRLGDSHSAINLQPLRFNGVRVPAGALWAVGYAARTELPWAPARHGHCVPMSAVACLRLLRLSTLAVAPADRARAFSVMVDAQVQAGLYSPHATTLADLQRAADDELAAPLS